MTEVPSPVPVADEADAAAQPAMPRAGARARRDALRDLAQLLEITGKPRWATPTLITLGFLSSIAETLGITLILLLLYLVTGQAGGMGAGMGSEFLARIGGAFGGQTPVILLILALILARTALALIYRRISADIGERISERARNMIHDRYLTFAYGFVLQHEQSQLMQVLGTESWVVARAYQCLTRLIINCCSVLVFGVFLLAISWQIALVAAIGSAFMTVLLRRLSLPAQRMGAEARAINQRLAELMLVTLHAMRTIRAYGHEAVHQKRFVGASREAREVSLAASHLSSWIGPATEAGYLAMLLLIIAGSSYWSIGFPATIAAVALLYRLQPHVRELEDNLLELAQSEPQLRSVRRMLDTSDKEFASPGSEPIAGLRQAIRFDAVDFAYAGAGEPTLRAVSFDIPVGKTTALIGASGAGKTTVVNLLLRLYQPQAGSITVDGVPLDALRRSDWLGLLTVAGQDVELVEGTVLENILMARPDASEAEVIEVARSAGVAEFIEDQPWGYETWIGQEGMRFSGGQRQRIGLARALLRNPQVLILDEATSALDRDLEDRIRAAIDARMEGRTTLIITHRLDTLREVEHAVWLENGSVRAEGPPRKMLDAGQTPL